MKHEHGFTLLELVMTMLVLVILVAVAVPAMSQFMQDNRTTSKVNEFVGITAYARSEAVARGQSVALVAPAGDWGTGLEVRLDSNGNGDFTDAGDELLRAMADPAGFTLVTTPVVNELVYLPSGLMDTTAWGNDDRIKLNLVAHNCQGSNNRDISISLTGIVTVTKNGC